MKYNSDAHHRRSIRLAGYDYSLQGGYFVTICVHHRENRFGEIKNGVLYANDVGKMIDDSWRELPARYSYIALDEYVVMPNHFHGIIMINNVGAPLVGAPDDKMNDKNFMNMNLFSFGREEGFGNDDMRSERAPTRGAPTIGEIVGGFKSITTDVYIMGVKNNHWEPFDRHLWQRNYYEHIIRDENDLNRIREYIISNPSNWEKDSLFIP